MSRRDFALVLATAGITLTRPADLAAQDLTFDDAILFAYEAFRFMAGSNVDEADRYSNPLNVVLRDPHGSPTDKNNWKYDQPKRKQNDGWNGNYTYLERLNTGPKNAREWLLWRVFLDFQGYFTLVDQDGNPGTWPTQVSYVLTNSGHMGYLAGRNARNTGSGKVTVADALYGFYEVSDAPLGKQGGRNEWCL